jgi:shikimate kinase
MTADKSNIILIGMPGSGKSTVGVILARQTGRGFIDTDVLIQTAQGRSLQDIVDHDGYLVLRKIEEETLLKLDVRNHVIATGGSAVYSHSAMVHLKSQGIALFLDADLRTLRARVHDYETRGLAKRPDQSLEDLFRERCTLYRKYADFIVDCTGLSHEEVCERIIKSSNMRKPSGSAGVKP